MSNPNNFRSYIKSNLKNNQSSQGYGAGPVGGGAQQNLPNKNIARLAFTANNFYDSRNHLAGVPNYGVRQTGNPIEAGPGGASQAVGAVIPRQSRSRQKVMKTNTYGASNNLNDQVAGSQNANIQNPYDNSMSLQGGGELLGHHSVNNARNTFYVSDNQRQKANLFKDLNAATG